jgi:ADP-ribosyl-[dinitrogen reductase] hydrolase
MSSDDYSNKLVDKYQGAMLGLAIGDATGTSVEFYRPGYFEKVTDMDGGGILNLPVGAWTDDTSMALCLAESLIKKRGFDAHDQLTRYLDWYENGYLAATGECVDIGMSTREALLHFKATGDAFAGDNFPEAAGNGSLMRLAAIPLAYRKNTEQLIRLAGDSSRTTHGDQRAIDACRFYGYLIQQALTADFKDKEQLIDQSINQWPSDPLHPEIEAVALGSYKEKQPPEIKGAGFVVQSMEAALWAFNEGNDYKESVLLAVNLGNDADTTAAICGQLAGAFYGYSGIPDDWLDKVFMRKEITRLADQLLDFSE